MRILLINDRLPYPLHGGAEVRVYNLLRRISKQHEVWLAALVEGSDGTLSVSRMEQLCARVETVKLRPPRRRPLDYLPGLGTPAPLRHYYSAEMMDMIRGLISAVSFDIVQFEHTHMAPYLEAVPSKLRHKSLLTFHDVQFEKYKRLSRIEHRPSKRVRMWLKSRMMRQWEPRYAEQFGRCIAMSEADRRLLIAENPGLHVSVVPNGVDTQIYQPLLLESLRPTLIFVGSMDYSPCVDAMLFFCLEVLPHIRRMIGEVELWIVGKNPVPEVLRLDGDGVHVTQGVDDIVPYYSRSAVSVVPLRAGGGTRLKILEAMALGRPVVSTTIGCEGLETVDGEHLLIADNPLAFAQRTVHLLENKTLYERITTKARNLVVARYDWDVITEQLVQIYAEVAAH